MPTPTPQKCNVGTTANFFQNTCIDSVLPTITIGEIKRTHSGLLGSKTLLVTPETPGTDPLGRQWLRDGIYEISVAVQDNVGGSGVDTSYRPVTIRSLVDGREYSPSLVDYNKFSVWVGSGDPNHPTYSPFNDCVDEKEKQCRVDITVRDRAGNYTTHPLLLNIDYTPPSAQ